MQHYFNKIYYAGSRNGLYRVFIRQERAGVTRAEAKKPGIKCHTPYVHDYGNMTHRTGSGSIMTVSPQVVWAADVPSEPAEGAHSPGIQVTSQGTVPGPHARDRPERKVCLKAT